MSRRTLHWLSRRSRLALIAGVVGAGALAMSTTASLGGFTASITNTGDKAQSGSLLMQEVVTPTGGTVVTCLSTTAGPIASNTNANCAANKFGAMLNAAPGAAGTTTSVVVTNQGSLPANTFTMQTAACAAVGTVPPGQASGVTLVGGDTAGYCGKVDVTIEDDTATATCIYPAQAGACPALSNTYNLGTLATAYTTTPLALTTPVAAGAARTYKFTVGLDSTATNADQAMAATENITYAFGS